MSTRRDPEHDLERLLDDGGGEIGQLYKRLPRYEPPRRLDRAILGEAARAVHSGRPPRRQRWVVGLGSAAGLVLAAGIAWRIGLDAMHQNGAAPQASPPVTRTVVPVEPISEPPRAQSTAPAAAPPADAMTSAPAQQPPSSASGTLRQRARKEEFRAAEQEKAAPARKPAAPVAPPPPTEAAAPPDAFPGASADRESENAADAKTLNEAAGGGAPAAKRAAPQPAQALPSTTPPSTSMELRRDMQLAPQTWLARIQQLNRQGRTQQAAESLRLFQRAHPDWTIPEELRPLLDR